MTEKTTLLSLPFELRYKMWGEVIGHHRYLHIRLLNPLEDCSSQRFEDVVRAGDLPETRRHKPQLSASTSVLIHIGDLKQSVRICLHCQENCSPRTSLEFLKKCRQIRGEAKQIAYTTSTFSFDGPMPLWDSGATLTTVQGWSLYKVHLRIKSSVSADEAFHGYSILVSAIAMLHGLES